MYDPQLVNASFTTAAFFVGRAACYSLVFSSPDAALNGSFKVQACNDPSAVYPDQGDANLVNWFDLMVAQTVSGASVIPIFEQTCTYRWIRVVYTNVSGTANITIRVQFKGGYHS